MGFKGIWRAGLCSSGMEGGFMALWDSELKCFCFQGIRSSLMETLSLHWFHIVRIRAAFTPSVRHLDPSYCFVCWRFLVGVNICAQHSSSCSSLTEIAVWALDDFFSCCCMEGGLRLTCRRGVPLIPKFIGMSVYESLNIILITKDF